MKKVINICTYIVYIAVMTAVGGMMAIATFCDESVVRNFKAEIRKAVR